MIEDYPENAGKIESGVQVVIGITVLAYGGLYATLVGRVASPNLDLRLEIILLAIKMGGLAFLLAVATTFFRRYMTDPPLVLIWAGLLITALVAWLLGGLVFLSGV